MSSYRYLVTQPNLNSHGTLRGGTLMRWVDEACGMEARLLTSSLCATRFISKIDFASSAKLGDIINISVTLKHVGQTSITFDASVFNAQTSSKIATFERIVFVSIDDDGKAKIIKTY